MKSGKGLRIVYKSLYIVSALLAFAYVSYCVCVTYQYYFGNMFTSMGLSFFYIGIGGFILVPSMITLIAAFIVHRVYRKKRLAATDIK